MVEEELSRIERFLNKFPSEPQNLGTAFYLYRRAPFLPMQHRTAVLEGILASLSPDDGKNELAELYYWLSFMYARQSEIDHAIRCQEFAADLAERKELLRAILGNLVRNLHSSGRMKRGVVVNERLIEMTKNDGDPINYVRALTEQGYMMHKLGRFSELREISSTLGKWINKIQDHPSDQGLILRLIGILWSQSAVDEATRYRKSVHYTSQAIRAFEEAGNDHEIANCFFNLASDHFAAGAYGKADECYRKAAEFFYKADSRSGFGMVLAAHGKMAFKIGDYEKSHELLQKATYFLEASESYWRLARALEVLGLCLEKLGRLEEAVAVEARAAEIRTKLDP